MKKFRIQSNVNHVSIFFQLEAALSSITNSSVGSVTNCVCFGQFFSSYVSNWSELEKKKAFCAFEKATKLKQKVG